MCQSRGGAGRKAASARIFTHNLATVALIFSSAAQTLRLKFKKGVQYLPINQTSTKRHTFFFFLHGKKAAPRNAAMELIMLIYDK